MKMRSTISTSDNVSTTPRIGLVVGGLVYYWSDVQWKVTTGAVVNKSIQQASVESTSIKDVSGTPDYGSVISGTLFRTVIERH